MPRPNGDYSRETSQERRRRRIEIRRNAAVMAAGGESLSFTPGVHLRQGGPKVVSHQDPHQGGSMDRADLSPIVHHRQGSQGVVIHQNQRQGGSTAGAYPLFMTGSSEDDPDEVAERNLNLVPGVVIPVVGAVAVAGMLQRMEDAVTVQTNLCSPTINHRHPVHFFGVFDGHGGAHVAIMCRDWMHVILEEELMRFECPILPSSSVASSFRAPALGQPDVECFLKEAWTQVFQRCFSRTEELAMNMCQCGRVGFECSCNQNWFVYSGSAAVVVVLTDEYIVAANCGDSRAILCCNGSVIPLTVDHKILQGTSMAGPFILLILVPNLNRPDELARIEASGGCVFVLDGAPRVGGILAMSRAIGGHDVRGLDACNIGGRTDALGVPHTTEFKQG
ncbi:probable protein phosphatase 2C 75 isoform X4 [Olea europaea var. sylvestris]|uniref:probable protein phosphatase 2C 75 isoform X4 n=1 Tax=Olea europaea var. sylvestris TaxID=158386 RepID=UPI000C1D38AB|nr:probable protein phosphatase 2C 75 isoform X4 [Olea europaea var. sylvestris]